eukprot:gene15348-16924_t
MPKPNTDCVALSPNALQVSECKDSSKDEIKTRKLDHMEEFTRSLTVDARAAVALGKCLDMNAAKKFIEIIERCDGTLITSGIGKSGIVAERMAASLSSTGTPAHYVHGAEWTHGDLGKARRGDVCVFFSHSGNTKECVFASTILRERGVHILSIVGKPDCLLTRVSDAILTYQVDHPLDEPIGGAPTTSVMLQEMVVNAVVSEMIKRRKYTKVEFARNHPGGSLGKLLCDKEGKPL